MAGEYIANLKGPQGRSVTGAEIISGDRLELEFTDRGLVEKWVSPGTLRGPQGLPGVNAVPADEAVAGYINTEGTSASQAAVDSRILGAVTTDGPVKDSLTSTIGAVVATTAPQRVYADVEYTPGSDVFPTEANVFSLSGWGSSSMSGLRHRMSAYASAKNAAYYNGSSGGERSWDTVARFGSVPVVLSVAGGAIPASGSVTVTADFSMRASMSFTGTLNGVAGTLTSPAVASATLTFTRASSGSVVSVPDGTPFIPTVGLAHRGDAVLLWMGKNNLNGTEGADIRAIEDTDKTFDWLAPLHKRAIVLGHFVNGDTPAVSARRAQILAVNAAHKRRYGRLFIDVQEFVTTNAIWAYTGLTPTSDDLAQQALGNKPPSVSTDVGHFNDAGYDAVMTLIEEKIDELGWYGEGPAPIPAAIITSDAFTGGDAATLIARNTDATLGGTAFAWDGTDAALAISGGKVVKGGTGTSTWFNGLNIGQADVEFSMIVDAIPTTAPAFHIDIRRTSTGIADSYRLRILTDGFVRLRKRVGGEQTYIGEYFSISEGDRVGIRAIGNKISVVINGATVETVTDSDLTAAGYAGIAGSTTDTGFALKDVIVKDYTPA